LPYFDELTEYITDSLGYGVDEEQLIKFITQFVATEEELVEIARSRLSVWHLLNGHYGEFDSERYYRSWNERSGFELFDL